jgi:hypothetical protein
MKKSLLSLLLALVPLALLGASGTAIPGGNQATPFIINKPGAYYLAANRVMTNTALPAIEITASGVTLDLNGFNLGYSDVAGTADAILAKSSNIEIRNGSITTAPGRAIYSPNEPENVGMRVIDVRVVDTRGLSLGSKGAWVERSQIFDSRDYAIQIEGWGGTVKDCVVRNVVKAQELGIGISVDYFGTVVGCNVAETAHSGIVGGGGNCTIRNNRVDQANLAQQPTGAGIHLVWSRHSHVSENHINLASGAGIFLMNNSLGCLIEKNLVASTHAAGSQTGYAFVNSFSPTPVLRGNVGFSNAGGFISGAHIDGGGNLSN